MLDGKILSAVLATLTAVAVSTTGGGDLQDQELQADPSNMDIDVMGLAENPVKQLREMFTTTPEPENSVRARLVAERIANESFQVQNARIAPGNATEIGFGSQTINSDSEITVYGYSGSVIPRNSSFELAGTAQGVLSSGVNVSGTSAVQHTVDSPTLEVEDVQESSIGLSSVSGTIESDEASTEFDSARTLSIDSFSGDITINSRNGSIILDGKVNTLEAGDFSFGS